VHCLRGPWARPGDVARAFARVRRDDIRAVDLVARRGHSRSGRRCSQFRGGCFSVPAWPPGRGRRAWRPARARWPCGGPRRGSLGVCPGVLAWRRYSRWGSDVGGVKGGGHRPDALGGRPTAAIPIVRVRRRRKPLGGRRAAAPRRCSERCPKSSPAAACVGLIASRSPLQGALAWATAPMFRFAFRCPGTWEQGTSERARFAPP
jgi:hypothetical protein